MRVSVPASLLLVLATTTQAGFLDRFTGSIKPAGQQQHAGSNVVVDGVAPPAPPSEPHVDAFGGVAPGGPSVAHGQPAVQTPATTAATAGGGQTTIPVVDEEPYTGREYRWKMFRIRPAEFRTEAIFLTCVLAFVGLSFGGRRISESQAIAWNKAAMTVLGDHFASYQLKSASVALTRVDPSTYIGHASGRRGTAGFAAKVSTWPRHDIFTLAYEAGYKIYDLTYASSYNTVTLDFELDAPASTTTGKSGMNKEDFVWALVKKNYMQQLRNDRFDLQAFTTLSEPPALVAAAGNEEWATFSEATALNELFFKKANVGVVELLRDEKTAAGYLRSIVVSDIIKERPDEATLEKVGSIPKSRRLTMTFTLPSSSRAQETVPLVELALNLVDVLAGTNLPNEYLNKAKKRRADVYALLLQESRKEAKDKATSEARAIKAKAEQERLEKMTPAERRKLEAKNREKEMMKMAKKQQRK